MTGEPVLASVGGPQHNVFQAPAWDYANGKRLSVSDTSQQEALDPGLWLFIAEGDDVYYAIGSDPTADGSSAGSKPLYDTQTWGETVVGTGQKIAYIRKTSDCVLWAIPAMTE